MRLGSVYLVLALVAPGVWGQALVHIQDNVRHADGSPAAGTYTITLYRKTTTADQRYVAATRVTRVLGRDGTLDVYLEPNDAMTPPGAYYAVEYRLAKAPRSYVETWVVPTTTQTLRIADVLVEAPPDWSGYPPAKPLRMVSVLPPKCSVGEYVMLTTAPGGQNTYACTSQDTWSLQGDGGSGGGSGSGDITAVGSCTSGDCFQNETANTVLAAPSGSPGVASFRALVPADIPDLDASKITSGTFADARISQSSVTQHQAALQISGSQIVSGTIPETRIDQAITRDAEIYVRGTANEITSSGSGPSPILSIANTFRIKNKSATGPVKTGTTLPSTCELGDLFFKSDAPAGSNLYGCTATNTWTALVGAGSGSLSFLNLNDTPSSYSGHGGKIVAVRSDETGLEFIQQWITGSGTPGALPVWTGSSSLGESSLTESPSKLASSKTIEAPIRDKGGQVFNVKAYGAVGDGATDDSAAIQSVINTAPAGSVIYFPTGYYLIGTPLSVTKTLRFVGDQSRWTVLTTSNTSNASILSINTDDSVFVEHLHFWGPSNATGGSLVSVTGTGYYGNSGSEFRSVRFGQGYRQLSLPKTIHFKCISCRFNYWREYAVYIDHEDPDTGGAEFDSCDFSNGASGSQEAIRVGNAVGTKVVNSSFFNIAGAVRVVRNTTVGSYLFDFSGNYVDMPTGSFSVKVESQGTGSYFSGTISRNAFAAGNSPSGWRAIQISGTVFGWSITGNNIVCKGSGNQDVGVDINTERGGFVITGNQFTNCYNAVSVQSTYEHNRVSANSYHWLSGPAFSGNSSLLVNDRHAYTAFADLGSWANGSDVWCYNCQQTNPCSSGGSGAIARRLGGAWYCADSGGGGGVGGSGTTGKLPLWTGSTTLGDSAFSEDSSKVSSSKTVEAPIRDKGGQVFNVKAYGAVGDGSTDDTSAIQSAINAAIAAGGSVFFPRGTYVVTSSLTVNGDLFIYGASPRIASADGATCESLIGRTGTTGDLFLVAGGRQFHVRDICLHRLASGSSSGAAVRVTLSSGLMSLLTVDNVQVMHFYDGIVNESANVTRITRSSFSVGVASSGGTAIKVLNNVNSDACETWVHTNVSSGMSKFVHAECFSLGVYDNKVLASDYAVYAVNSIYNSSQVTVQGNRFDIPGGNRIYIAGTSSSKLSGVKIQGNWVVSDSATDYVIRTNDYVDVVEVHGNIIWSSQPLSLGTIVVGAGYGANVANNYVYAVTGTAAAISVQSINAAIVESNSISGAATAWISASSATLVKDNYPYLTYSQLGGWLNGSSAYCSDCQQTNPCSSGGSGAFARRVGGQWNCAEGGGGGGGATSTTVRASLPAAVCQGGSAALAYEYTSSPPAASCYTGTNSLLGTADFNDSSNQLVQARLTLPPGFNGTASAHLRWFASATSGSVVWQVQTACVAPGSTVDPSWNTAQTVTTAAPSTAGTLAESSISSLTVSGCSAENVLLMRFGRLGADSNDTMTGNARLVSIDVKLGRSL